jgi:molybdopterin synthase sulfur carrier subunit
VVRVAVPSMLAAQADGRQRFDVEAKTVGDALHALPVADLVLNERGELRPYINVYVDGTDARGHGGLACPLGGAQEVRIVAMLSGG